MTDRCPQCRGLVRPDAPWCTQCWTDLRPAPPVPRVVDLPVGPPAAAGPASGPADVVAPALVKRGLGGWPCTVCSAVNAVELDACAECGSGFLAGASSADAGLVVPGLGDLTKVSRTQRLALAVGAALLFMVLVGLVGLLG